MSATEEKNPKKSKRSFIPKFPSLRRKKNPSPESTPTKASTKAKKQKKENSSSRKSSTTRETQTPQHAAKYPDKSASLAALKEEEQNGNTQSQSLKSLSNINKALVYADTATSFINPEYKDDIWRLQQNAEEDGNNHDNKSEINANIDGIQAHSPTHSSPVGPIKTACSNQHLARCSSTISNISSGSSLSLSSPGSLSKVIGVLQPYKSVFSDEPRGVKRQGSTPSDLDVASSCVSVSGSVSSLSPTVDEVATKVTVRSANTPALQQYPIVAPVDSLSPAVSPKHGISNSKREGAYTYDSSGLESEDGSGNCNAVNRQGPDVGAAQQNAGNELDLTSIVNLNFDLKAAAVASPQLNANIRRERQQSLASKAHHAVRENTQKLVTERQEDRGSTQAVRKEALISPSPAAVPNRGLSNKNPKLDSTCEASIASRVNHASPISQSTPSRQAAPSLTPHCRPPRVGAPATAGSDREKSDEVVLTRVTSVTSPTPAKTQRAFYSAHHLQLSAMRNKLRSESFDSSDLDSLASDDLMCEADTFVDQSDESLLMQGSPMTGEQGFSPYPSVGKGKRLRNNSIEYLVASFDKRHRHHSTGQTYSQCNGSPRGNLRATNGSGPAAGRDTIVLEASTYRQMLLDLSSMKTALVRLGKMLQDPKALSEMLVLSQQGKETRSEGTGPETMDSVTQCDPVQTREEQVQTDTQNPASLCEAAVQSEDPQREDRAVQSVASFTGCQQCTECFNDNKSQDVLEVVKERTDSKLTGCRSRTREACLSTSSSSSAGEGGRNCIQESWRGSSGLDQDALSPLGKNHSSGDTSDDSTFPPKHQLPIGLRKHVRISDEGSDGSYSGRPKCPNQKTFGCSRLDRGKLSSSDEGSIGSGRRLKYQAVRFGDKIKNGSTRLTKERASSSDDGCSSRGRIMLRHRNHSDSSNEESEDSTSVGEKSRLPQLRRPASRMQRPRQIQRPKAGQHQGRKPEGQASHDSRSISAASRLQRPVTYNRSETKPQQEQTTLAHHYEHLHTLEWQQTQLQQQQEKLNRQHEAARRQQQENQQRLLTQQQKLQKDQQDQVAVNLQKQQEILVEQQQQQMQMQLQLQQHRQSHQWQKQRSVESVLQKSSRPQGMIVKRSSNQDLTSSPRTSPETVKTTQELRHSSPSLINSHSVHTATVHHSDKHNGTDGQRVGPKSRLPAPASVAKLTGRPNGSNAGRRDTNTPVQTKNIANGISHARSKLPSPKSPRRIIPTGTSSASKIQAQSPSPERRIVGAATNDSPRHVAGQLQCNQNNNPSTHHTTVTSTTTTTITTMTVPQSHPSSQVSRLPSPVKSMQKPMSRLAQPKVKVQGRIPKASSIPVRGKEAN